MIGNLSTAIKRPVLPTLADIERRRAELLNYQLNHPQQQSPPDSAEPPRAAGEAPAAGKRSASHTAGILHPTSAPPTRGAQA